MEVIDLKTKQEPDLTKILLEEGWTKGLSFGEHCRTNGILFNLDENGQLFLRDEFNNVVQCPMGRFNITLNFPNRVKVSFDY